MAFQMTAAAAREILAAAGRSGAAGMALRVAARPARDGGLSYGMGFDQAADGDQVAVFEGLTVLVGAGSSAWLADTVLDYVELDSGERDFVFVLAEAARGCGASAGSATPPYGGCGGCASKQREQP